MRAVFSPKPEKHIFVCVNERENDSCCERVGGEKMYVKLKEFVKMNRLTGSVWLTRSRCLGFCNDAGTTIVVYPEGKWLTEVGEDDFEMLIKELF